MTQTITGTNEEYNQLFFWCVDSKPEFCQHFNQKDTRYKDIARGPITIGTFPSDVNKYLNKYCSLYRQLSKAMVESINES